MRNVVTNAFLIGSSIAWLFLFSQIALYGEVIGREPNLIILWLEIAFFVGLSAFGVSNIVKAVRRHRKSGEEGPANV